MGKSIKDMTPAEHKRHNEKRRDNHANAIKKPTDKFKAQREAKNRKKRELKDTDEDEYNRQNDRKNVMQNRRRAR